MSDQAAVPPVDSAPALSQWQRVVDAFIAPSKTFTDIRRSTSWWLPWLLAAIIGLGFTIAVQQQVGWNQVAANTLRQNPKAMEQMQKLPPDQLATAQSIQSKTIQISAFSIPLLLLLTALVGSAVLWGTVNFLFGGRAKFGQMYAVWFYATLPLTLVSLLSIITLYAGLDPGSFNLQNPVGTNIGYYLSSDAPHWLSTLLSSVDVLKIWAAVLLTIGCAKVGQIKKSSAAVAVFGWWILFILLSVGATAITGT
jgi:hypothetical protein